MVGVESGLPFKKCATCGRWFTEHGIKSHIRAKRHKQMKQGIAEELFPIQREIA